MKNKRRIRWKLVIEGIIALIIATSPILFYAHKYIPPEPSFSFIFFEIGSNDFPDVSYHFYYLLGKIVPLLLLIIWFITSKQWWYHAILIPISMYSFQLFNVMTNKSGIVDENEILYIVAVTMVIIPVVYFIRIKLVDKYVHGIDLKAMDEELQVLKAKQELREEREKLEQRKKTLSKKM